ncbi:ferric reductase-like transmembrane domain-containing protein [Pelovirga terrestris]|uniref:Ferredoxin reductase family protein n=1 Tax=Pelovirga terrestris TaxID=2771352 RepID=A0A8J6QPC8_9BACT|nr:ferredoxin reductase family protein [Pelovirga terrestris]MBD1400268.1 ferredoxin reductase family protein [Pelovirga terrestris]
MSYVAKGAFWIGVYLLLILAPLAILLIEPVPPGNGFWWDVSLGLGFAGTAMMGMLFLQTARFRRASAPFGIDIIYYFHRQVALIAVLFIVAHPIILLILKPQLFDLFKPGVAPAHLWGAVVSTLALLALVATSIWRKQLALDYDLWRVLHALLAVLALGLAIWHVLGVGHYVDTPWRKQLWGTFSLSWLLLLVYVRLYKPLQQLRHPYRVVEVKEEKADSWSLTLEPDGHAGLRFQPGQFAWLTLGSSPFALKEHPFSFAGSAEKVPALTFTIKELGDFSSTIKQVKPGQIAYIDGPYGAFSPDRMTAGGFVLIAGGIGIAPMMSVLRTFADRREKRPLKLLYAYNTWDRLTFRDELQELEERLDLEIIWLLKDPPPNWEGESGLVTADLLQRRVPLADPEQSYLICGPVKMIELTEKLLHQGGVPLARIHSELFDMV